MNIYLMGFMGVFKTSAGRILAAHLNLPFLDADEICERRIEMSISAYFEKYGEAAFRDIESAVISEFSAAQSAIIALGGGAILKEKNLAALKATGRLIWLNANFNDIFARIENDASRPLASDKQATFNLFLERQVFYEKAADCILDIANTPEETAARLLDCLACEDGYPQGLCP